MVAVILQSRSPHPRGDNRKKPVKKKKKKGGKRRGSVIDPAIRCRPATSMSKTTAYWEKKKKKKNLGEKKKVKRVRPFPAIPSKTTRREEGEGKK